MPGQMTDVTTVALGLWRWKKSPWGKTNTTLIKTRKEN
jgi:hypothetical protein